MSYNDNSFKTGEQLYNEQIVGGLNKLPVNRLKDGTLSTLVEDLPIEEFNKLDHLVHRLLVSGSIIVVDDQILHGSVPLVVSKEFETVAYQVFVSPDNKKFLKKWIQTESITTVFTYSFNSSFISPNDFLREDVIEYKLKNQPTLDIVEIASDGVIIVENGVGILIPASSTIDRINELMNTLEETTGEEALTWFVTGWVGDISKLIAKTHGGTRFVPVPDGATIQNASDASFSDRVFKEIDMLKPMYLEATYSFVIAPGESGIARYLGMLGYINKLKQTQKLSQFVFNKMGIEISFDNSIFDNLAIEN
jgi:hypothetical protein